MVSSGRHGAVSFQPLRAISLEDAEYLSSSGFHEAGHEFGK
jgi:hypothetical protein